MNPLDWRSVVAPTPDWRIPHVTHNDDTKETVLEWWHHRRKVALYVVSGESWHFILLEGGEDGDYEMDDGRGHADFAKVFQWLAEAEP